MLNAIFLALNFFPDYKTKTGALMLVLVATGTAYNSFVVPQFGLPPVPADWLTAGAVTGNAVLGVGVANNKIAAK